MKKCSKCKTLKPKSEFYSSNQKKDGLDCWCKKCKLLANQKYVKNPEVAAKRREFRKIYNLNTKERRKFNRMKHLYGVTFDQYNELIKQQNGKCKICDAQLDFDRHAHIDHCHKTKEIRGVLCGNCNSGLGHFKDNVEILRRAIEYLCPACHEKEHKEE